MVSRSILVFIALLVVSCAQVGRITGGDKDNAAPKIIVDKSTENGQTNFEERQISLVFDEYFKLNNPAKTITIVPNDAIIKPSIIKKNLRLEIDGDLKPNTTYAIYFNRAIKDITEGNDSIFQFVFSTGPKIDSLQYGGKVIDAQSGKPIAGATIILQDNENIDVERFCSSESNGSFLFSYLPPGNFSILAIDDKNLNAKYDSTESVGFPSVEPVSLLESMSDSVPIRVFVPEQKTTFFPGFIDNYLLGLGSTKPIGSGVEFYFNNEQVNPENIIPVREDSLLFLLNDSISELNIVVHQGNVSDSLNLRHRFKNKTRFELFSLNGSVFMPADTLKLVSADRIKMYDRVLLISNNDTISRPLQEDNNSLHVLLDSLSPGDYILIMEEDGIEGFHGSNNKFRHPFSLLDTNRLCGIEVQLSGFSGSVGVRLIKNNLIIKDVWTQGDNNLISFNNLVSGEYSFEVVEDLNSNLKWDTGSLKDKRQPEPIYHYSKPTKLRPGWGSSIELRRVTNE